MGRALRWFAPPVELCCGHLRVVREPVGRHRRSWSPGRMRTGRGLSTYRVCEAHAAAVCRRRPRMHGRKLACITRPSVLCGNAQDAHCAQLRLAQACRSLCRPPAAHSTRTFELHLMMPIVLQNPVWSDHGETACTRAKIVRYPCDTRAIPQAVPIAAWGPTKALRNLVLHWRCSGLLARGGKNGRHEFHTPPLHNTNTTP